MPAEKSHPFPPKLSPATMKAPPSLWWPCRQLRGADHLTEGIHPTVEGYEFPATSQPFEPQGRFPVGRTCGCVTKIYLKWRFLENLIAGRNLWLSFLESTL